MRARPAVATAARATPMSLVAGLFLACAVILPAADAASAVRDCERAALALLTCPDGPRLDSEHAGARGDRPPTPTPVFPGQAAAPIVPAAPTLVDAPAPGSIERPRPPRGAPVWSLAPKTSPPPPRVRA